jgi:hypothetical protein
MIGNVNNKKNSCPIKFPSDFVYCNNKNILYSLNFQYYRISVS